ncbi:hypothetical protein ABL78_5999 [Leptomonas seymouri]|uniref:Uncharacterized protein n=1 Tax=Leptomonas seymouri TaxID=5684 RepID=A0A0N0P471_LEPSE|nr:hypothetical protein ABL78_5999 [Leptomonas seymouri]|eukprot:KPI84956.1 hypothetical protein ABL78_5999 [Leptomonas seymouri]
MSTLSAVRAAAALLLVALQLSAFTANAYSVRYSTKLAPEGYMSFGLPGFCAAGDRGHTMMPKLKSYQTSAYAVMKESGFKSAPIGGESRQSACLDENCNWQFSHGLYFQNQLTFFFGVFYDTVGLRGGPAEGVYNNFASGQPVWWGNVSYWGSRQPYMQRNGTWANTNVVTYFTQWVCEYYEYHKSDAAIFPTYPDGDVIVPSSSMYYHCGKLVERDSQGRWIYQRCNEPLAWWAALTIAVLIFIAVVSTVIVVCCCCFYCDRYKERREGDTKLGTVADNPAQVPTQTELGLSRHSSVFHPGRSNGYSCEDDADEYRSYEE